MSDTSSTPARVSGPPAESTAPPTLAGMMGANPFFSAWKPLGEYVTDSPVSPADLAATIYTVMGVPLHTWYKAQDGRPIELCPEGKPVKQLM